MLRYAVSFYESFCYRAAFTCSILLALSFDSMGEQKTTLYSPYADKPAAKNVYWGDTHVHTVYSVDAAILGRTKLTPEQAYQFAQGQQVVATSGSPARLKRPLDFIVLSDHAEYLGMMQNIQSSNPLLLQSETGKRWHDAIRGNDSALRNTAMYEMLMGLSQPNKIGSEPLRQSVWSKVIANAENHNNPGQFTAFIGYEFTSSTPAGDNLHRNVIFRDGADKTSQILPFSAQDSMDPEDLWKALQHYEDKTSGKVMAIAHNGNLSNGRMFSDTRFSGTRIDQQYVEQRARWEPLYEVTQIKGDGETHPLLSPDDEFADFENWDLGNLANLPKPQQALATEYARSALKLGMSYESRFGTNPFKFGMIGSTDSHTGLATAGEDNFWGKFSKYEPNTSRSAADVLPPSQEDPPNPGQKGWTSVASGYAAVWASENTREALFDAMQRKETYATTGPRMVVRFYGGFDFAEDDIHKANYAQIGSQKGVPMGGELSHLAKAKTTQTAPTFLVSASKDPEGANLDRIQIIKGWINANGEMQERIYDVAVSDGRRISRNGRVKKAVGSTVDIKQARYSNTIGAAQLASFWRDPEFDPAQNAFYYTRVIEIPKPRWTAYDAKYFGIEYDQEVTMTVQDRAYTSPIWYTPAE